MSLSTNVSNLATRIATESKALRTLINGNAANLSSLTTTEKASLVGAINELAGSIAAIDVSAQIEGYINDSATASDSLWSSSKINTEISNSVTSLVDGAPGVLDTLNELAAALGDDSNFASTVAAQIADKADLIHDHAVSDITGLQTALDSKANAADVGDTTTNYVTAFEAGLV
jgi:hypothetical protein